MKRFWLIASILACAPVAGLATDTTASMPRGVIELYTSQGCAFCPQADHAFTALATDPSVIALSFHVDYWNYLGWKDTFGSAENTERQYSYADTFGRKNVYTPQVIVNGRNQMKGSELPRMQTHLQDLKGTQAALDVPVNIERDDDCYEIRLGAGTGTANVMIVYFAKERNVAIAKGENAGKTIVYRNIVQTIDTIGMWKGEPLYLELPLDVMKKAGRDGAAILVQSVSGKGDLGPIRGAALLPLGEG